MAKPQKDGESDRDYIERLERSNSDLKAHNTWCGKERSRIYDSLVPAAQKTGQILQCAAEICDLSDNRDVQVCIDALTQLGSAVCHDDMVEMPEFPKVQWQKTDFSGDIEMLTKSALEIAKSERELWVNKPGLFAKPDDTDLSELDWTGLWDRVEEVLMDLDVGRTMLRLDMRSAMYDRCFNELCRVLRTASDRQQEKHPMAVPKMPF